MPAWPRRGGTRGQRPAEGGVPPGGGGGDSHHSPQPMECQCSAHLLLVLCLSVLLCSVQWSCCAVSISPALLCPSVLLCHVHRLHCAVSISRTVPCLSVPLCPLCTHSQVLRVVLQGNPLGLLRRSEMVLHSRQRPRWRSVLGGSHGRHFGPAARTGAGRCCSGAVAALTPQHSPQRW